MTKQVPAPTELERLFRTARRDVPTLLEQRRLQNSVLAAVRAGQPPAPDLIEQPLDSGAAIGKLAAKLLGSLGVVAVMALGIGQWRQHRNQVTRSASDPPQSTLMARSTEAPSALIDARVTASSNADESSSRTTAPTAQASTSEEPGQRGAAPAPAVASDRGPSERTRPKTDLPNEAALIDQAHRELTANPARALQLTEMHRRLYPRGLLVQEREVIAIDALARLGKARAAEQRGSAFRNEQPHSIHELRLREVLGDAGVRKQP